ncbi:MAG: type II secretion system inner membrane protein GspF [Gammaproteobacteria bacterium]|nr:type II secretion system inner membrane protein GspF [Gammaproteobacteria bacterium]
MPAYEYKALNESGREVKGVLEGDNARQIRQQLREKKLTPLSVSEGSSRPRSASGSKKKAVRGGLSTAELALITRQVATLSASGLPLEEALSAIASQSERQKTKALILSVRSRILEGHTFASALSDYPKVFPEIYRATVAAGEQSGHLDAVLERLADYTEDRQSVKQTVTKALMYPMALVIAAIAIVSLLLAYVVPQVVGVFDSLDQELPALTRMLIMASDFLRAWGLGVLAVIVIVFLLFRRALSNEAFRLKVDTFYLKIGFVSKLIRAFNSAQFARTLSILASSGVPVLEALSIASAVLTNRLMRQAVKNAAVQVREGSSLSASLKRTGLFPPMMLHLIASGESSGRLGDMLEKAATQQERELDSVLTIFLGLFEPLIILVMGGTILIIVLAILLPIFQLNQLVS